MKKVIGKLMLFVVAFGLIACVIGATNEWIYALYFILVLVILVIVCCVAFKLMDI